MNKPLPATPASDPAPRRQYSAPVLTVYGPATVLTQDPQQSRPTETVPSPPPNTVRILFLGDNV